MNEIDRTCAREVDLTRTRPIPASPELSAQVLTSFLAILLAAPVAASAQDLGVGGFATPNSVEGTLAANADRQSKAPEPRSSIKTSQKINEAAWQSESDRDGQTSILWRRDEEHWQRG